MTRKEIDALIQWKVYDVLAIKERRQKGEHDMQYQFNIEVRVDFEDKDKIEAMKTAVVTKTRELLAMAKLLNDKVAPDASCFSDDFFHGQKQLALYPKLEEGKQATGVAGKLMEAFR